LGFTSLIGIAYVLAGVGRLPAPQSIQVQARYTDGSDRTTAMLTVRRRDEVP
jgi:hypothetical protein